MEKHLIRVELHDAEEGDYNRLHEAMRQEGFLRSIQSNAGQWYKLPTAEYYIIHPQNALYIKGWVVRGIAGPNKKSPWVIVAQFQYASYDLDSIPGPI